jgi:23S rRNA (cytidine2498-2'-O)-methyltransferase
MPIAAMQQATAGPWVFLCEQGWESALAEELGWSGFDGVDPIAPGWLAAQPAADFGQDGFGAALAAQGLYGAERMTAPSIGQWSKQIAARIVERLQHHDGPWRLHVFSRYPASDLSGHRRAALVRESLLAELKKSQRRRLRTLHESTSPGWRCDEALVQLGLLSATEGFFSITPQGVLESLRRGVSRFPAGAVEVPRAPQAPSRAFAKLAEVEIRLGRPIAAGETCADLGSSPGSWAWLALQRGAQVTAIDRAPLRSDLMEHPELTFVRGDAFQYVPPAPMDWLMSDIIAFPDRILRLLDDWLSGGWCRRFCATIKFRGAGEYSILKDFRSLLDQRSADYVLRRLTHNRNEVTAYGVARGQPHERAGC